MFDIAIADELVEAGVSVTLGCIRCRVRLDGDAGGLGAVLDQEVARCNAWLEGLAVAEVPQVAATRKAYKALGKDPARYRPSAEALLRRLAQGKGL